MPRKRLLTKTDLEKSNQPRVILKNADDENPCTHEIREIINPPNPLLDMKLPNAKALRKNLEVFYK